MLFQSVRIDYPEYDNGFRCQGYEGVELEKKVELILKWDRIGAKIGKIIPLGEIGFQTGIFDYDPRQALIRRIPPLAAHHRDGTFE